MTNSKPSISILIGFAGYGKTSFVSTCYHIVLTEGHIGNFICYDSDTLTGFERRLFMRRYNGKFAEETPQTLRTLRGEAHLLTLHFYDKSKNDTKLVVISDHSGEDYKTYASVKNSMNNDILIQNADALLFFIDSNMILTPQYISMKDKYMRLLNNMKESGVFKDGVKIKILFNKADLIPKDNSLFKEKATDLIDQFSDIIGKKIDDVVYLISNDINKCEELKSLFSEIVSTSSQTNNTNMKDEDDLDWVKSFIK